MSFNLLNDPWIDVVDSENNSYSVGIIDAFKNAHNIKDLKTTVFHGATFPFYNYLAIRLLCGILVDAYNVADEDFYADEVIEDKQFDVSSGSILSSYFEKYKDCFELFSKTHPFMQTGDEDLKKWKQLGCNPKNELLNVMKINPCAPAETGRITEVKAIDMSEFLEKVGDKVHAVPNCGVSLGALKGKEIASSFAEVYAIPAKEWAYICLYQNSIAPGSGSGNKSCLAGNGYYAEVLQCRNLFQTIVANSAAIAKSDNRINNKPIWRWDSQTDIFLNDNAVVLDRLSGLFCPSKVIRGYADENNVVKSVVQAPLRFGKNVDEHLVEDMRQKWALDFEPHFVVDYLTFPVKNKKGDRDYNANPYRKFSDSSLRLWSIIGATQTNTNHLNSDDLKAISMAARNIREVFDTNKPQLLFDEDIYIRIYYRICVGKWIYKSTGTMDGHLPAELFFDEKKQSFIRKVAKFSANMCECLDDCASEYRKESKPKEPKARFSAALSNSLYSYIGVNGEKDKLLYRIATADSKEDFDKLWEEFSLFLDKECKRIWGTIMVPWKISEFYTLSNKIYKDWKGKKGVKLYV